MRITLLVTVDVEDGEVEDLLTVSGNETLAQWAATEVQSALEYDGEALTSISTRHIAKLQEVHARPEDGQWTQRLLDIKQAAWELVAWTKEDA